MTPTSPTIRVDHYGDASAMQLVDLPVGDLIEEVRVADGLGSIGRRHEPTEKEQRGADDHDPDQHLASHVIQFGKPWASSPLLTHANPRYTIPARLASKYRAGCSRLI